MTYRELSSSSLSSLEDLQTNLLKSDDDSEVEFQRILQICSTRNKFYEDSATRNNQNLALNKNEKIEKVFDPEYYTLSAVQDLQIHVEDDILLEKFGIVEKFVDFLAIIKPNIGVPYLDYDTMLFNEERNAIGEVFEIYGSVHEAMYAIRFNSAEEACNNLKINQEIFYAPEENYFTKVVLMEKMSQMKISDDQDVESEPDFSNDESEAQYYAKKKAKNRNFQENFEKNKFQMGRRAFIKAKRFRTNSFY